ncbi:AhpC-TSA-domain-containing protein [Xylariaceae sp. FL1019]|nr:AhpC-TSA-domain-containing protein [Xylariaceae sp. FL1019]
MSHEELQFITMDMLANMPEEMADPIFDDVDTFSSTFDPTKAIQMGSALPESHLIDTTGRSLTTTSLLASGPLLITFYRGEWCPYCNAAIGFLQAHASSLKQRGVTPIAITPEQPEHTSAMSKKHSLVFPVYTDPRNALAKQLGIVYDYSVMRDIHLNSGVDLAKRNDGDSWDVPIPASLLVDRDGVVRNLSIDPDYRNRLDPQIALKWAEDLSAQI